MLYICNMEMRIRQVPDDLHWRFRKMCLEKRTSMNKRLIQLIEKDLENHEREEKK